MIGVGLPIWERDMLMISAAKWFDATIEQLDEFYGFDYSDLVDSVAVSNLRVADVSELYPDARPGWTRHVVGWTMALNAHDHEIQMIRYDVITQSPDGDVMTRQYQLRSEEVIA